MELELQILEDKEENKEEISEKKEKKTPGRPKKIVK